jgi:hypothetical protein
MRPGDANDPLLRQVLPQALESVDRAGIGHAPVAESPARVDAGFIAWLGSLPWHTIMVRRGQRRLSAPECRWRAAAQPVGSVSRRE